MAKAKTKDAPKHHEKQRLQKVEVIRGRVLRLMRTSLGNLRSFISLIEGNQHAVELLRGQSGDAILGRCAEFVMMELGDSSSPSKSNADGVSRYMSGKVKGSMGPESEEGETQVETAEVA